MRTLLATAAIFALLSSPASADYKSEYQTYSSAIASGDTAGALSHGEAAWRAAETELGDVQTTAVLAYNFGRLASMYSAQKAIEPFGRALEIAAKVDTGLNRADIALRLAEARVIADPSNTELAQALAGSLKAAPEDEGTLDARARGWRTLAAFEIAIGDYNSAMSSADQAVALAQSVKPLDKRLLREALNSAGVARVVGSSHRQKHLLDAIDLLDRALDLFPSQESIDGFDRLYADTIAWRLSIRTFASSLPKSGSRPGSGVDPEKLLRAASKFDADSMVKWRMERPAFCKVDRIEDVWSERKPPKYPTPARNDGNVGTILIGYDLNATGVERAIILADFSAAGFGDAAVESMKDWKLASPQPEECRKNRLMYFTFYLR